MKTSTTTVVRMANCPVSSSTDWDLLEEVIVPTMTYLEGVLFESVFKQMQARAEELRA